MQTVSPRVGRTQEGPLAQQAFQGVQNLLVLKDFVLELHRSPSNTLRDLKAGPATTSLCTMQPCNATPACMPNHAQRIHRLNP